MTLNERHELAKKRILSVTGRHGAITSRTLEHKIADGGPYNQRINPHIITNARRELENEGELTTSNLFDAPWYYLKDANPDHVRERIQIQGELHRRSNLKPVSMRVGQALEIAVQKALDASPMEHMGRYTDLDDHDDTVPYIKEEPPSSLSGLTIPGKQKLDFLARYDDWAGIEVKNIRPWIYPDSNEVRDLIAKCISLDIIPVLIARRIAYVTDLLLRKCGVLTWQTLRQRYPVSEEELANELKHKELLGYADISLGSEPDANLQNFISVNLPDLLTASRVLFEQNKDLLNSFAHRRISYREFSEYITGKNAYKNETSEYIDSDIPF